MEIFDVIRFLLLSGGIFSLGYILYRPKIMKFALMAGTAALGIAAIAGYHSQLIMGPAFYMAGYAAADIFDGEGKHEMHAMPKGKKRKTRRR